MIPFDIKQAYQIGLAFDSDIYGFFIFCPPFFYFEAGVGDVLEMS
jgi:hypothetical protein